MGASPHTPRTKTTTAAAASSVTGGQSVYMMAAAAFTVTLVASLIFYVEPSRLAAGMSNEALQKMLGQMAGQGEVEAVRLNVQALAARLDAVSCELMCGISKCMRAERCTTSVCGDRGRVLVKNSESELRNRPYTKAKERGHAPQPPPERVERFC